MSLHPPTSCFHHFCLFHSCSLTFLSHFFSLSLPFFVTPDFLSINFSFFLFSSLSSLYQVAFYYIYIPLQMDFLFFQFSQAHFYYSFTVSPSVFCFNHSCVSLPQSHFFFFSNCQSSWFCPYLDLTLLISLFSFLYHSFFHLSCFLFFLVIVFMTHFLSLLQSPVPPEGTAITIQDLVTKPVSTAVSTLGWGVWE